MFLYGTVRYQVPYRYGAAIVSGVIKFKIASVNRSNAFDRLLVAAGRRKRIFYSLFLAVLSRFLVLFSDRRIFVTYFSQYFAVSRIAGAKMPCSCHYRMLTLKLQGIE